MAGTGEQFAQAIAAKDAQRLRSLLAADVDFQALTPGRHWVAATSREAVEDIILKHWFGPDDHVRELRSVRVGQVADREHLSYRLGIRSNGEDCVVEQQAYYTSNGEQITWIRILCSGYRPAETSRLTAIE